MDAHYEVSYDSDEAPRTRDECRTRLIEAIIWEFLDEDCGLFMESPCSTFHDWNEAAQKRYKKEALKLIKELESGKKLEVNVSNPEEKVIPTKNLFRNPTLRDYMRLHVGN
jgi:hypothetical protein|tara:strand:+ start:90 stop:422 length:333 start_codon:yes stop_codon:yes gene_type:complete